MKGRCLKVKLIFKQRLFSWFDSYDIYDEAGNTVFTVKGQLSWGHCLKIFASDGSELGTVKEKVFTFPPKFELYLGNRYIGCVKKRFLLFRNVYDIDCRGWTVNGDVFGWNYNVVSSSGNTVATVSKELFRLTDTYVIDVNDAADALYALMLTLAIDAEKCSSNE